VSLIRCGIDEGLDKLGVVSNLSFLGFRISRLLRIVPLDMMWLSITRVKVRRQINSSYSFQYDCFGALGLRKQHRVRSME
jgi:hypothetical protein